jgi:anti-sigma B factor antagonist
MQISEKTEGKVNIVCLAGRLDGATAEEVEKKLVTLASSREPRLVLNLKELEYISSAGLRVLLGTQKKATKQQGEMRLACLNPSVKDVLDIAGFTQFFKLFATEEDAVKSFA